MELNNEREWFKSVEMGAKTCFKNDVGITLTGKSASQSPGKEESQWAPCVPQSDARQGGPLS